MTEKKRPSLFTEMLFRNLFRMDPELGSYLLRMARMGGKDSLMGAIHNTMHNHYQERPQGGQDMKIDLDKRPIPQLEATETLLVPCSKELVGLLESLAGLLKTTGQGLLYRYIVEGLQRDVGEVFGMQPHLDKPLKEVLK